MKKGYVYMIVGNMYLGFRFHNIGIGELVICDGIDDDDTIHVIGLSASDGLEVGQWVCNDHVIEIGKL